MRAEHKNIGLISVDRSHWTTFRTYNTQIYKFSEHTIHKHYLDHVVYLDITANCAWHNSICLLIVFIPWSRRVFTIDTECKTGILI